jgi:thioester reductase-like protein
MIGMPERILLTGATGFLGAFLLRGILDCTDADVVCLVRAASQAQAEQRIRNNLSGYGLKTGDLRSRVRVMRGDLEKLLLGLGGQTFGELAEQVDTIIHNGARVNLMDPYQRLKPANVLGTHEIYRLAAMHQVKSVHYVSTIGTLVPAPGDPAIIPEDWETPPSALGTNGYVRTKWVAERIAQAALHRGIPTLIYRPGRISGHSLTGAVGQDDAFWHYVRACIELKAAPDAATGAWSGLAVNLVPVDYVVHALLHLALNQEPNGRAFSLLNSRRTHIHTVLDHARDLGYSILPVPYAEWLTRLGVAVEGPSSSSSSPAAVAVLTSQMGESGGSTDTDFSQDHAKRGLVDSGIVCPEIDSITLNNYFRYFIKSGFLASIS